MTLRSLRAPVLFLSLAMLVSLTGTGPARSGSDSNRMVAAARKRPPNILLIVTDDQRKTPLWDMPATRRYFQKGGVEYTNAFVTTPLCCPSRSSIMTGQYVHNHGVHSNGSGARLDVSDTIQRYLNKAGYRTALIGKYLNAWGTWKPPQFWDRFAYFLPWGNKYYKATFNIDGKVKRVRPHSNRFMANHSLRLLEDFERSDNSPWFMYIAPKAPHKPFLPAPGDRRADVHGFEGNPAVKESELDDKPPWVRQCWDHCGRLGTGQSRARQQQRTLLSVDDLVSDVFKQMDTLDEDRQTLAFFISDNGYMWGEHGMIGKSQPYDQSVGVPFFARWPGRLRAGSKDGRFVANIGYRVVTRGRRPQPPRRNEQGLPAARVPRHEEGCGAVGIDPNQDRAIYRVLLLEVRRCAVPRVLRPRAGPLATRESAVLPGCPRAGPFYGSGRAPGDGEELRGRDLPLGSGAP
jgi:hypothetical protein